MHAPAPKLVVALVSMMVVAGSKSWPHAGAELPPVVSNDNRIAAGTLRNGVLEVALEAGVGAWRPYGANGPALPIMTFGETGKALQSPGPLIRVKEGTRIHARVHNATPQRLVVHGLASHRVAAMDTLVVPSGATRDVAFTADDAGTYYYWAALPGTKFVDRVYQDALLNGALIVDGRNDAAKPDRVFVIQWYVPRQLPDSTPDALNGFFTFNGRPWPSSERLSYTQGDSIRWRFVNASADVHPLHLHGFYYRVTARGDDQRDSLYWPAQERVGVTELMNEGTTMSMTWKAERPGAWIFHCHLSFHVVPNPAAGVDMKPDSVVQRELFSAPAMHGMEHHAETGMGGLVLGVDITPSPAWKPYAGARDRLRLFIVTDSQPADTSRRFGYVLARVGEVPDAKALQWPGPPLILHRGQPTSIRVINQSAEPSQVHWHGLEIDSYYDGVAGLSRSGSMVSPVIMPRDSFEVTVTPPRAGSFMYHTHLNDLRQQSHGLYGPIIVLDSGATWDREHEMIFQVASNPTTAPILNGSSAPPEITARARTSYRMRLMNVTLDAPHIEFWLSARPSGRFLEWTALAKDGRDLPEHQRVTGRSRQRVSIGETFDFRVTFPVAGDYVMEIRSRVGAIRTRQMIHVVE